MPRILYPNSYWKQLLRHSLFRIRPRLFFSRHGGFSRLELMIVAIFFGIVASILLDRLFYYQEAAEKADMEYTASVIKSAVRLKMATLLIAGRAQEYRSLAQQNPMEWLEKKPASYLGSFSGADTPRLGPGHWYFDSDNKVLVYLVKNGKHFQSDASAVKSVQWRMLQIPANGEGLIDADPQQVIGSVQFIVVKPYRWF